MNERYITLTDIGIKGFAFAEFLKKIQAITVFFYSRKSMYYCLGYKKTSELYQTRLVMRFNGIARRQLCLVGRQRNMRSSKGVQVNRSNDLGWYLLAEYALDAMILNNGKGDVLTAGFLFQPFQELGVPPELIRKIEMTLTGLAQQTRIPGKQIKLERSGNFRVFCHKKVIDDANSVKKSSIENEEQGMEHVSLKYHTSTVMNAGWGYFIIERSGGDVGTSERSSLTVDLYLYQEGK